ncbi:MAG: hypothetical protein MI755_11930 [Sphingomonadales bacterium]|nr:hypothetical protein [Sphingomonadales bacterium]
MKNSRPEGDDNTAEDLRRYRGYLRTGEYISQEAMLDWLNKLAMGAAAKVAHEAEE